MPSTERASRNMHRIQDERGVRTGVSKYWIQSCVEITEHRVGRTVFESTDAQVVE
ncbi:hypothetical protein Plhal304r1_c031g0102041 [Plasmopara halstedii]